MAVAAPANVSLESQTSTPELLRLFSLMRAVVPDAYLVGGATRDLLQGRVPLDVDITTRRDARAAAETLAQALGGSAFAIDEPRRQFRVTLHDDPAAENIDVSQISDLESDLRRRDFTVNAMARPIFEDGSLGEISDPCGGLRDLEARRLRMVDEACLRDDPLRLLRAVRLAVELAYEIEPDTGQSIQALAPMLNLAAAERRREELTRMLATPAAANGMRLADDLGLLDELLPELSPARGVDQPPNHHYYDVFDHSLECLAALDDMLDPAASPSDRPWLGPDFREGLSDFDLTGYLDERIGGHSVKVLLKLAGLLHDISKPETKKLAPDGRVRFLGHSELGAAKAASVCDRLRFGSRETRFVARLVEEHLRPTQLSNRVDLPSPRALYRFFRDLDRAAPACLVLSLADAAAATGPRLQRERWRGHVAYTAWVLQQGGAEPVGSRPRQRLVNGDDLIRELHMTAGPEIGRVLAAVEEAQAVGEIGSREEALAYAMRVASTPPDPATANTTTEGQEVP